MKKIILFLLGFVIVFELYGQSINPELISSSADTYSNSSYQLDWSIGECVTATFNSSNTMLTQGFHQGLWEITAIKTFRSDISISFFPNPTSDFIYLKSNDYNSNYLQYVITDLIGKVILKNKITSEKEQINVSNFNSGTYFLTIYEESKQIQTFKLIKN